MKKESNEDREIKQIDRFGQKKEKPTRLCNQRNLFG